MLLNFFKNIKSEIARGNKDLDNQIDDVFAEKAKCGCWGVDCCDGFFKLPVVDASTHRFLYVVEDSLFFGTKADVDSARAGNNTGTLVVAGT